VSADALTIGLKFNRPQLNAWNARGRRRTVVLPWGRGVGKSWFIRHLWWLTIAKHEYRARVNALEPFAGVRIIALMPTLKQFKDVHGEGIEQDLHPSGKWGHLGGKIDRTGWGIKFPGGSWVKPFPAMEHSSKTARGLRCDIVSPDEIDDIDPSVYESVAVPWLSEPWSFGLELGGGTPRRGRHGLLYKLHRAGLIGARLRAGELPQDIDPKADPELIAQLASYYSFHATYRDAPENVSQQAVLKARANTVPAVFKREWECDFDAAEGLVYGDVFDERYHVQVPPAGVVWSDILIGADHGWEDPGCLLLIGVIGHGKDAVCWVLDEIYEQHRADSWWAKKGGEWFAEFPRHRFYADPSRPGLIEDYRKAGARPHDVDNCIEDGVGAVADRFVIRRDDNAKAAGSRLFVHPKCVNVIRELGTYRRKRDPRDHDRYLDEIEDRNNHAMDALRYPIIGRFGRPSSGRNRASYDDRA
jgi:hypothetical protein